MFDAILAGAGLPVNLNCVEEIEYANYFSDYRVAA